MFSQAWTAGSGGSPTSVTADRRAHPRFPVSLAGVCSLDGGRDFACTTIDLSLGGLSLCAKVVALAETAVSISLPQIGLVHGLVVRTFPDGFALRLTESHPQRRRIANFLTWLVAGAWDATLEDRAFERIVPLRRLVTLTTREGASCMARIIDISRVGVAVQTTAATAIGDKIRLGTTHVTVARLFEGGLAASLNAPLEGVFDASIKL